MVYANKTPSDQSFTPQVAFDPGYLVFRDGLDDLYYLVGDLEDRQGNLEGHRYQQAESVDQRNNHEYCFRHDN